MHRANLGNFHVLSINVFCISEYGANGIILLVFSKSVRSVPFRRLDAFDFRALGHVKLSHRRC